MQNIIWNEFNTPKSCHFDDVYFSNDDAIAETRYVFIEGNDLVNRFIAHNHHTFTIGETGFGSGLSFLIAWQTFLLFRIQNPNHILKKLRFCSVEKFPLSKIELQEIHQHIVKEPQLIDLAKQLQVSWPNNKIILNDHIELDILFSDASQFAAYLKHNQDYIDAWFFDGFSPQKNSDMWSLTLFTALYQITKQHSTFATFSAAGFVRRNLIDVGFIVKKRKGFAKKREMLTGYKL